MTQVFLLTTPGTNFTYTSDPTWNNTNNTVEVIGAGGAGARGASTSTGGGGGAGGGYNKITNFNFTTPGTSTATCRVGLGGVFNSTGPTITNGGDTWFNSTAFPTSGSAVGAKGGPSPATATTATGATAAATSTFFPTTSPPARAGGNGANGTSASVGGGGGGAGGPSGAGGNASSNTGGSADGGAVAGGSPGNGASAAGNSGTEWDSTHGSGSGGGGSNTSGGTGGVGGNYGGGGGGGSRSTGKGGNGANGIIVLTWVPWIVPTLINSSPFVDTPTLGIVGGGGLSRTSLIGIEHQDTNGVSSLTTTTFTPPANSLLVVSLGLFIDKDVSSGVTISDTGGGLTYTLQSGVIRTDNSGFAPSDYPIMMVWTAPVGGSPAQQSLTIGGFPSGNTIILMDVHVVAYTGYDTGSPIGATGQFINAFNSTGINDSASLTLSAAPASDSFVFASIFCGANSAAGPVTAGSGWTEIYDWVNSDTGGLGYQSQERTGSTSTSVSWADVDTNDASGGLWGCAGFAMEIKAASAGGGGTALAIDPLVNSSPVVPSFQAIYNITTNALVNGSPFIGLPDYSPKSLFISALVNSSPVVPSFKLIYNLATPTLANASPVIPQINVIYNFKTNALLNSAPSIPGLVLVYDLVASQLSNSSPVIPQIKVVYNFSTDSLVNTSPFIGLPDYSPKSLFISSPFVNSSPILQTPALSGDGKTHFVSPTLINSSPVIPNLQVTYNLIEPAALVNGSPIVPGLSIFYNLSTGALLNSSPVIPQPKITYDLIVGALANTGPSIGSPSMVLVRALAAINLVNSSPAVGSPSLSYLLNIVVPQGNLVLIGEPVGQGSAISPNSAAAVLSSTAPSVMWTDNHNIFLAQGNLSLSESQPVVFASDDHLVSVPSRDLFFSTLPPGLIPGNFEFPDHANITLDSSAPTVTIEKVHHWRRRTQLTGGMTGASLSGRFANANQLAGDKMTGASLSGRFANANQLAGDKNSTINMSGG